MKEIVFVFLGGGAGSVFRYLLHLSMNGRGPVSGFPWSTFTVNVLGSLLIGIFYALSARFHLSNETRLFLTVGLCGGFTTFSTFSGESLFLLKEGMYLTLASYVISSILLGIPAVLAGAYLIRKV
ncbi:MAG: fluoride efflux transporter CrcB [Mediterranea sp.]|jgi:CrcB protein|nr:fluoride efflux transporter CrcB [Mediterranea sp.]